MMVIAVGLSSYNIALFHLVNHAFYKALLFLGAGAVIHAVADNQDFRKYGGLKSYLPLTYSVMLIASLSLVAFPFMTGFYSKDFILESAYGQFLFSGTVVYFIATIGAMFTTLYSVKVLYLTFLTNPNGPAINYIALNLSIEAYRNSVYKNKHNYVCEHKSDFTKNNRIDLPYDDTEYVFYTESDMKMLDASIRKSYKNIIKRKFAHEGDIFMSLPLIILAIFSIFFGYITKDIFIGLGSGFFADNSLFIHPMHEIMLDTEFAVPTLFKLLPLMFTISFSTLAIVISEFIPKVLISFKLSRLGYNIFGFFNQRFLIELFYNKYITGLILKLGGQTTKVIDKGSVELLGPYGLEKGLITLSINIASLDTGVITSYALYISIGFIFYMSIPYLAMFDNSLLILILLFLFTILKNNVLYSKTLANDNKLESKPILQNKSDYKPKPSVIPKPIYIPKFMDRLVTDTTLAKNKKLKSKLQQNKSKNKSNNKPKPKPSVIPKPIDIPKFMDRLVTDTTLAKNKKLKSKLQQNKSGFVMVNGINSYMESIFSVRTDMLVILKKLENKVLNLYKVKKTNYSVLSRNGNVIDPYALFTDRFGKKLNKKDILSQYPALGKISDDIFLGHQYSLKNITNEIVYIPAINITFTIKDIRKMVFEHNLVHGKLLLESMDKKKTFLAWIGYNTPSPSNFKATPLIGTAFIASSNNEIISFYYNWMVSSFLLGLEANQLFFALKYYVKKSSNSSVSNLDKDCYIYWQSRQINNTLIPMLTSPNNEGVYLIDYTLDDNMSREIMEDYCYVLLNLILANTIINYMNKFDLYSLNSKDFFKEIQSIIDNHYLSYSKGYDLLFELRMFLANNHITEHMFSKIS